MMRSRATTWAATLILCAAAGTARGQQTPVATPPVPTTPAENDLGRAKRDADRSANDAGRAAGNPASVDGQVDAAKRTAKAADALADADLKPTTGPAAAPDNGEIRRRVADLTAVAVTPGHLDGLTQRLAQPDRDRLRTQPGYAHGYGSDRDAVLRQFAGAWQAKYGHPFTAAGAAAAVADPAFARVEQGSAIVGDPRAGSVDAARRASMAVVRLPASHGLPALTVPLVREMPDGWKVDVPDTETLDLLMKSVGDEVGAAVAGKGQWPADEADAYRAVAHRLMLAVMGQPLPAETP